MKILLFGKNGQLGWELQRSLQTHGQVLALHRHSTEACGDLSQLEALAETVRRHRPDVIVNAAAYTAVDLAESEADLAHQINAAAPAVLAQEAQALGALLIHYSSDYVFDGQGEKPWQETDPTAPLNVYGASKLAGEQAIAAHCERHLIFRTSWVYGLRGQNFAKTMLRLAVQRDRLQVVADQWGAPTGADLLADVTSRVLASVTPELQESRTGRTPSDRWGVYHLAAAGVTNWHQYAQYAIGLARQSGLQTRISAEEVQGIPSQAYPTPAKRPQNSRLDTQRLRENFGLCLPDWQLGIQGLIAAWTDAPR